MGNYKLIALVFLLFGVAWEIFSDAFSFIRFVLPAPSAILQTLWISRDRFLIHSLATLNEMVLGIFWAFWLAFPLAWLMLTRQNLRTVLQPLFIFIQCIPIFTLAPLMILWFGWSLMAIIVPTVLMIFFPLTMSIYQGLRSTPTALLDYFRVNQATSWQLFFKLQLPWAMPHLFSGLRIAIAIAGIGAVAGEWAGAQQGLGILMLESRRAADLEVAFAALFCLTALSLFAYSVMILVEVFMLKGLFRLIPEKMIPVLLIAVILSFQSCGRQDPSGKTRLVLDWLPNPNHVPIYVALDKGFFADVGIHIQLLKLHDAGDALPFLTSGQTDLAITYMPHVIAAQKNGAQVTPVGILIAKPLNSFIFRRDSGIKTPQDLQGKSLGYFMDEVNNRTVDYIFDHYQITPGPRKNLTFDLVSVLGNQMVDCIYAAYWNIECEHLGALGIDTDYFVVDQLGVPPYHELLVLAALETPQAETSFIAAFKGALQNAIDWSKKFPDQAFEVYARSNPDKSPKTLAWEKRAWIKTLSVLPEGQEIDKNIWAKFKELFEGCCER